MNLPNRSTILRVVGLCASILMVFVGVLLLRRQEIIAGLCIILAATILFILTSHSLEKKPLTEDEITKLKPFILPGIFWILSVSISGLVLFTLYDPFRTSIEDILIIIGWPFSILFFTLGTVLAVKWRPPKWDSFVEWLKINWKECVIVAVLLTAGLILRLYALNEHPYPWSGDEASIGSEARRIFSGDNYRLFSTGWSGQPYWSFVPTGFFLTLWGENIFAIRMVSVIVGSLTILTLYLLSREVFSREVATVASAFLVSLPFHLQFSRIGVHNINDGLMITLVLWLVFRSIRTEKTLDYLWAGISIGLTFYTYVGTRLVLAIGLAALVYSIIRKKGYLRSHFRQLITFLAAMFITIAPMAFYFFQNQYNFMTRLSQENIILNGWLVNHAHATDQSILQVLLSQISKSVFVFISQNAYSGFLNFPRPYLTLLGAVVFIIGFAVSIRHLFQPRYLILHLWFWSVVFLGGVLTLSPPASTRLVMTTPAIALFISLGIVGIFSILEKMNLKRRWTIVLTIIILVTLTIQNVIFYHVEYRMNYYFRDANGEVAMVAGLKLKELGSEYTLFLLGYPRMFVGFPTFNFLAPDNEKYDLTGSELDPEHNLENHGLYFVSTPDNVPYLREIADQFDFGEWEIVQRISQPEVLYYAYLVHPNPGK